MYYDVDIQSEIEIDDDEIVSYVAQNFDPEDVFDNGTLATAIVNQDIPPETVYGADCLKEWIRENYSLEDPGSLKESARLAYAPEDIYTREELEAWAVSHGFIEFGREGTCT